jgi:hypothetical protein
MDLFIRKTPRADSCTFKLVAITSIVLSVKMNEDRMLSLSEAAKQCDYVYGPEMIEKMEKVILLKLNFRTNIPTALDFL